MENPHNLLLTRAAIATLNFVSKPAAPYAAIQESISSAYGCGNFTFSFSVMRRYAVLIDAGFLKRKLGSRDRPLTADSVQDFVNRLALLRALQDLHLHRVYFYDAPPLKTTQRKPLSGDRVHFANSRLALNNQRLHKELRLVPYVALRMGDLKFRGWTLNAHQLPANQPEMKITSEHLVPNVHQKGVDMRVGLDIASLTLKNQVEVIVLVTGDSDFVPAMKFARREGAQLFLVTFGHSVTEEMREHADLMLDMD